MSLPLQLKVENKGLGKWAILTAYRGSIAHGLYIPQSNPDSIDDKDIMAVCVPPPEYYIGLKQFGSRGTKEIKQDEWDIVIYEMKKFIGMLENGNPNVLGMLWLRENHYILKTYPAELLIKNRDLFVGRHVYHSFSGYAHGQFKRMTHLAYQGYMGEKRKRLVQKFGYDTKNAAHLIRLLKMCIEFLKDGELYVFRGEIDAPQLLSIKNGEWTLEQVQREAEHLFKLSEKMYTESKLPKRPDREKVSKLCEELIEMSWTRDW